MTKKAKYSTVGEFKALSRDRVKLSAELVGSLGKEYRRVSGDDAPVPIYEHLETGLEFRLIPAGEFVFGLSEAEEKAARQIEDPPPLTISELRPTHSVFVNSFLLSVSPLLVGALRKLEPTRFKYMNGVLYRDFAPACVERHEALAFAQSHGWRLPLEIEWEYAIRAGTRTLFVWGDRLLPEKELAHWLEFDLAEGKRRKNAFGLWGLFSGDWCMDGWTESHSPSSSPSTDTYVIKGGGSIFWPWQGSGEWVWCMPANRMPSTGLVEKRCAFRLVRELSPGRP